MGALRKGANTPMATKHQPTELKERDIAAFRAKCQKKEISEYATEQFAALLEVVQSRGMTTKQAATETGMSASVISQIYNVSYTGNYDMRARLVERYIIDQRNRELFGGRDDFIETQLARSLWLLFEKTRHSRRIQTIQSEEQLGKSRAAQEYTNRNNHKRTILTTLQPGGTSSPFGVFLRDAAIAAGVLDIKHRKIMDVRYQLADALQVCDLFILDEFHQIEHWTDRAVRDLLDFLRTQLHQDGKRGVVLIATNSHVRNLLQSFRNRTNYNLGQLYGRMCNNDQELSPEDIPYDDVAALVGRYGKFRKSTTTKLYDIATRPGLGHLGLLCDIMNSAWTECKLDNRSIDDDIVLEIARDTMDSIKERRQ